MSTLEESPTTTKSGFRHKGHVKFFNSTKGYGFILPDNPSNKQIDEGEDTEEVFVHHTAIHNSGGFKSLAEGEQVEYDLVQGPKGMQASNVTGPNGVSVQGDPRTHRQQYPEGSGGSGGYRGNNNNNNRNSALYSGYMMDPYSTARGGPFGYAIPAAGFPFINIYQQGGGGGDGQLPPHHQQQFHHHHHQQQQHAFYPPLQQHQQHGNSPHNNSNSHNTSPQLLQQPYSGYIPQQQQQPMYYNNNINFENTNSPQQQQHQSAAAAEDEHHSTSSSS